MNKKELLDNPLAIEPLFPNLRLPGQCKCLIDPLLVDQLDLQRPVGVDW